MFGQELKGSWPYGQLPPFDELLKIVEDHLDIKEYPMSFLEGDEEGEAIKSVLLEGPAIPCNSWVVEKRIGRVLLSRVHFSFPAKSLTALLIRLANNWECGELPEDQADTAGHLASGILETLDCEWV